METTLERASGHCEHHGHEHDEEVVFHVNNREVFAHRGHYAIATIKALAGVPLADDLDLLAECKLKPLPDDGHIMIHGHEIFVSHVKDGGSA